MNVGSGEDLSILDLARLVAEVVGYDGAIEQDLTKPDGTPRKLMDVSRLSNLGWSSRTAIEDGVQASYHWFLAQQAK